MMARAMVMRARSHALFILQEMGIRAQIMQRPKVSSFSFALVPRVKRLR
jgi:hypothetical protein